MSDLFLIRILKYMRSHSDKQNDPIQFLSYYKLFHQAI